MKKLRQWITRRRDMRLRKWVLRQIVNGKCGYPVECAAPALFHWVVTGEVPVPTKAQPASTTQPQSK